MTKNENTRPAGGTAERATETAAFSGAAISCNHSNTAAAGRHLKKVMEADGRTVRLMIQQERLSGMPICADNLTGYYLPATPEERTACVCSMRHRAGEIMRTARAIERAKG